MGQTVTLTATVTGAGTPAAPTGTVDFTNGSTAISGCTALTLANGAATCSTSFATVGTYNLTASYSGGSTFNASSSSLMLPVTGIPTTATITAPTDGATWTYGTTTTFTATVTPSAATGTVTFRDNSNGNATVCSATVASGTASCSSPILAAGTHVIYAAYSGDSTYAAVPPPLITVTVTSIWHLAFTTQPGGASAGGALVPQPVVALDDPTGNLITSNSSDTVVLQLVDAATLSTPTNGAILIGVAIASFSQGVATFTNLTVNIPGTYQLTASTSAGSPNVTSSSFDILALPYGVGGGGATLPSGVTNVTTAVNLSAGVSTASGGTITVGGQPQPLNSFSSGDLSGVNLTAAQSVGGISVNVGKAVQLDSGTSGAAITLASAQASTASATLPDKTTILAPANWDGTIQPPTTGTSTGTPPAGFSVGSTVIDVGSPGAVLLFDKAATLVLPGVTGQVGYRPAGSTTWVAITAHCGGSYATPASPSFPGECFISNGTDTTILTYHFTSWASLNATSSPTATATPSPTSDTGTSTATLEPSPTAGQQGGGGGGGGGAPRPLATPEPTPEPKPTFAVPTPVPGPTPVAPAPGPVLPAGALAPTLDDAAALGILSPDTVAALAVSLPPDVVPVGCTDAGCSVDANTVGLRVLSSPSDVHAWRLTVPDGASLRIVLTGLVADLDVHVFGPDGSFVAESTNEGLDDDVVALDGAAPGQYVLYVNSPRGEISDQPYGLAVLPV